MAGLGLRPVSDTSDRPGWRVSNRVGLGGVGLGGPEASLSQEAAKPGVVRLAYLRLRRSLGWHSLRPVSDT